MTAVIYARYSSDNQREESIEGQIRECTPMRKRMASPSSSTTLTEVYPLRGIYLGHFYFSVVSAGSTPYSSALTGSA